MDYKLKRLEVDDNKIIAIFYQWKRDEPNFELYTCRPVKALDTLEEYKRAIANLFERDILTYYLMDNDKVVLGKITLFDYNVRNKSAEFGYYLPKDNRGKGYGSIMLNGFIEDVFGCSTLNLNKLYATTASGNLGSVNLLKKHHFSLDGVLREHYWIGNDRQNQLCYSILRREWESI